MTYNGCTKLWNTGVILAQDNSTCIGLEANLSGQDKGKARECSINPRLFCGYSQRLLN